MERWLVLGVIVVGGLLRAHRFNELGLSHFDEGVYALSGLWPWSGQFFPDQGYFSPPLFPFLVGLINGILGGPSDLAPASVSLIASTLTVLALWWIGRLWFSPEAGILAAWWGALDGFQITFARVGLTDATFALLTLVTVWLIYRSLEYGRWASVLLAGLAVGFTWNVKYNGFLPLLLSLGFLTRQRVLEKMRRLALVAVVGIMGYLPWAWWFHVKHSYPTLIEHQRGYFRGVGGLVQGWQLAWDGAQFLWSPWMALPAILALVDPKVRQGWGWVVVGGVAVAMGTAGGPAVLLALAVAGTVLPAKRVARFPRVWLIAWLVLLPALYTPYLRLWLPTEVFLVLFAGHGLIGFVRCAEGVGEDRRLVSSRYVLAAASVGLAFGMVWFAGMASKWSPLSEPAEGYRSAGRELAAWQAKQGTHLVGLVRPPLVYYLLNHGGRLDRLAGDALDRRILGKNACLVTDHARIDSPKFHQDHERLKAELITIARFHVEPGPVTLLDDYRPSDIPNDRRSYEVRVEALRTP
ncbi:MAG: glycosyltransferase family 39 protein [Planctomycetota bacterium]